MPRIESNFEIEEYIVKKIVKAPLAIGAALAGMHASDALAISPATGDNVLIGCSVPPSGTAGATVYSIDAVNATGDSITLASSVTVGSLCTAAVNALTNSTAAASQSTAAFELQAREIVTIANTGYSLQQFALRYDASATTLQYGIVGCSAPASSGGVVYSIDAFDANSNKITDITGAYTAGENCSRGLNRAATASTVSFDAPNLTINNTGYSLSAYLVTNTP